MTTELVPIKKQTLFDVGNDWGALDMLIDEMGGELVSPEVEQQVDAIFAELARNESVKLAGYVSYVRQLEMESSAAKEYANHYAAKAKSRESRVKWLKERMKVYLEMTSRKEAVTAHGDKVCVQKNGGKPPIQWAEAIDVEGLDPRFVKTVKSINTDAVEVALKAKEILPFAKQLEPGTHLRIR